MTMLDRMRRHRDWLKWSLGLVCVAFVLFYIPDFLRGSGADAASGDTVAKVEGREPDAPRGVRGVLAVVCSNRLRKALEVLRDLARVRHRLLGG